MKFVIFRRLTVRGRRWFFHLKAANGEIVCQSEAYTSKAGALNGIEAVKHCQSSKVECVL
jgi:uncharacterized protein YegP (UPF0339 family)